MPNGMKFKRSATLLTAYLVVIAELFYFHFLFSFLFKEVSPFSFSGLGVCRFVCVCVWILNFKHVFLALQPCRLENANCLRTEAFFVHFTSDLPRLQRKGFFPSPRDTCFNFCFRMWVVGGKRRPRSWAKFLSHATSFPWGRRNGHVSRRKKKVTLWFVGWTQTSTEIK